MSQEKMSSIKRANRSSDQPYNSIAGKPLWCFNLFGDSMEPEFFDGDMIVLDESIDVIEGRCVFARFANGLRFFRKIERIDLAANTITFTAINPAYPPYTISRDGVVFMAAWTYVRRGCSVPLQDRKPTVMPT